MEILHVSAECYPLAKVGGLADVVGALPKYQQQLGHTAKVIVPMHRTGFLYDHNWEVVHKGSFLMGEGYFEYTIIKEIKNSLQFDLYCVDIYGLLDREKVYGYDDDSERYIAFQIAVINWLLEWKHLPEVIHVHDYHAGLIPFMTRNCYAYKSLSLIKIVLTIHNAQYQGWMDWSKNAYLPKWDKSQSGLLEWNNSLNPLASGIKCADKVNTVSEGYMQELIYSANGLEDLFKQEKGKCSGILNGIDYTLWDPAKDSFIEENFNVRKLKKGKAQNKKKICDDFGFDFNLPLIVFIGRLVYEKAADLLPGAISQAFETVENKFSCLVLGNGNPSVEEALQGIHQKWFGYYHSKIEYNEKLSHQLYAGADFLLMPSRVEPCGLNQMYAMRYGTIPIVRRTGGLSDTVIDYEDKNGYGICFNNADENDIVQSIKRAVHLYEDKTTVENIRKIMMKINNSWSKSATTYIDLYHSIYK